MRVSILERNISQVRIPPSTPRDRSDNLVVLPLTLEYFEGVMFLTTNRVQTDDPACKIRIHLSTTCTALSVTARSKLWEIFIFKGQSAIALDGLAQSFSMESRGQRSTDGRSRTLFV